MNNDLFPSIPAGWQSVLSPVINHESMVALGTFLQGEIASGQTVFPAKDLWFNALQKTPLNNVKVVILGQDPYHGVGQAHGLSFSVQSGIKMPPSLNNIFKEIASDFNQPPNTSCDLTPWAEQGVLLLNATLTVQAHNAGSHQKKGWERFTDYIIKHISRDRDHVVFLLWGSFAQSKIEFIDQNKHTVLTAPHPSPLSAHRGFMGCKHFSACNNALEQHGQTPINWTLQGISEQSSLL